MFHFFPRFSDMNAKVRSTAMCELVLPDLASLVQVSARPPLILLHPLILSEATQSHSRLAFFPVRVIT
jgi:hypothetical protein